MSCSVSSIYTLTAAAVLYWQINYKHNYLSLSYGHSFCASCVRQNFKRQLEKKLSPAIWNIAMNPLFKTSVICKYLISNGQNPVQIFSYNCPCCSTAISKLPTINRDLETLINDLVFSIPGHELQENRAYHTEVLPTQDPDTFFADIFLAE